MLTPRQYRLLRDRTVSVTLAIVIGVVIGVGAWLIWDRTHDIRRGDRVVEQAVEPVKPAKVELAAHKALYRIDLVSARNGSQLIDIKGKMMFQMHIGCEGYITDHRFALQYDYADSEPMRITSDFSTVESLDAKQFNFSARRRRNGEIYEDLRGIATRDGQGGGSAIYSQPKGAVYKFDADTVFPGAETIRLIEAARMGKKFLSTRLFDGSDADGPIDVTAVIGPRIKAGEAKITKQPDIDGKLLNGDAWRVHMAFFPVRGDSETADYEIDMLQYENGVIADMTIDYHDFTLHQGLVALGSAPVEACPAAIKN